VLAVGDTPYDIEGAGKAQTRTIALLCGGFLEKFWLVLERSLFSMVLLSFCFDTRTGPISVCALKLAAL